MQKQLLGYSESTISRIIDSLISNGDTELFSIILNLEVEELIPFSPPDIRYKKFFWDQWKFDYSNQICLLGVMKPTPKKLVFNFFKEQCHVQKENYFSLFHSSSVIASTAQIQESCIVEPLSIIASFAQLGFGVYINRGSSVGHHTNLEDFVTINPGVHIAGHCNIGNGTEIGIGSVVFDHIKIGANTVIGGGSVVTKDIPDNVIAWGNPCKVIKTIEVQ